MFICKETSSIDVSTRTTKMGSKSRIIALTAFSRIIIHLEHISSNKPTAQI